MTTVSAINHDELFDDDGYPSDYALEVVSSFEGSPQRLVELIRLLWRGGDYVTVRLPWDDKIEVRFITCGWSGNESIIGALERTMFNFRWWDSSHRGGLHVYKVRVEDWDREAYLGDYTRADAARYFTTKSDQPER